MSVAGFPEIEEQRAHLYKLRLCAVATQRKSIFASARIQKPNPSFGCMPNGKDVSVYRTDTKRHRLYGENETNREELKIVHDSFRTYQTH